MNQRFKRVGHRKKMNKRGKPPKGYDSWLEYDLHKGPLKGCSHHPNKLKYTIEREYEPDFVIDNLLIETKGRFRDRAEASKYIWLRKSLWENYDYELIFVFENPDLPMPHAKKRKCGTKQSHAEWAEKNGFLWYGKDNVPKSWSK